MSEDGGFKASAHVLAAMLAALAAPALAQGGAETSADDEQPAVQACLPHPTIRRTKILNERNIVFVTRDHTIYNNELPKECPSLKRNSLVNYPAHNGRLCAGASFQVLWETGLGNYVPAFLCQLGAFVPITEAELEDLTAMTEEDRGRRPRGRSRREAIKAESIELPRDSTADEPTNTDAETNPVGDAERGVPADGR